MYTKKLFINQMEEDDKPRKGTSGTWLVTFADMSLLLMTFFIILLTFANMDIEKFRTMLGGIQEYFGVETIINSTPQTPDSTPKASVNNEGVDSTENRRHLYRSHRGTSFIERQRKSIAMELELEEMVITIMKFIKDARLEGQINIIKGKNGIRMQINSYLLFDEGETNLKKKALPFLDNISHILLSNDYFLIVEGHSDNTPINSSLYASNWELSGARASGVIRYLIGKGVPSKRLTGIGFSSNYPLFPNTTPENRAKNRRVELIITNVSPRVIIK